MLEGKGGNIGVHAGNDGVFLVDDQDAPLTAKILAAVEKIDPRPVRFVLNAHWHGDHTGGNENFGKGRRADRRSQQRSPTHEHQSVHRGDRLEGPAVASGSSPDSDLQPLGHVSLSGEEIHAFKVAPAHTDGDAIVYFKTSNVLHMGALFFNHSYPSSTLPAAARSMASIPADELVLVLIDENTQIIPGYGPLAPAATS